MTSGQWLLFWVFFLIVVAAVTAIIDRWTRRRIADRSDASPWDDPRPAQLLDSPVHPTGDSE